MIGPFDPIRPQSYSCSRQRFFGLPIVKKKKNIYIYIYSFIYSCLLILLLSGSKDGRSVRVTTLAPSQWRISRRSRSLNLLEPQQPFEACSGKSLPFTYFTHIQILLIFIHLQIAINLSVYDKNFQPCKDQGLGSSVLKPR